MKPKGRHFAIAAGAFALAILGVAAWLSWPHLRFWWLFEPLGLNAQGYPEYRHRSTRIIFVSLPGGKFWMGAQKDDPNGPNYDPGFQPWEAPVHEVELSPFKIAKHEVTQGQWERVMGTNPSRSKGADLPVEMVSWEDCQEFCRKAELKLPTEAQWECACRGSTSSPYGRTGRHEDIGWFQGNSGGKSHPVGKKEPNCFGLHDMQGNVFEWCEDLYKVTFYSTPTAAGLDPVCTSDSQHRVLRGGTFSLSHVFARCAIRNWDVPFFRTPITGFRVVASPAP